MSVAKEVFNITQFLKQTLKHSNTKGFALGLSGGIDSAVCAALAARAFRELRDEYEDNRALSEKIHSQWQLNDLSFQKPSEYPQFVPPILDLIILPAGNVDADAKVATEVAHSIGYAARTVPLSETVDAFTLALGGADADKKTLGNLKARLRMTAIYYAANMHNLLVLGTDNAAETYTGYFTKHGDGAADVFPLSEFSKREVYEIGRYLGLPESVLTRAPSAGLWDGQTDEDELGIPYEFIDNAIEGVAGANIHLYGAEKAQYYSVRLAAQHRGTEHKRAAPHIYKRG